MERPRRDEIPRQGTTRTCLPCKRLRAKDSSRRGSIRSRHHGPDVGNLLDFWRRCWIVKNGSPAQFLTATMYRRTGDCLVHQAHSVSLPRPSPTCDSEPGLVFSWALTAPSVSGAAQDAVHKSARLAGDDFGTVGRTRSVLRIASLHCSADLVTASAGASDAGHRIARRVGGRSGRAVRPFWSPDSAWAARSVFPQHP